MSEWREAIITLWMGNNCRQDTGLSLLCIIINNNNGLSSFSAIIVVCGLDYYFWMLLVILAYMSYCLNKLWIIILYTLPSPATSYQAVEKRCMQSDWPGFVTHSFFSKIIIIKIKNSNIIIIEKIIFQLKLIKPSHSLMSRIWICISSPGKETKCNICWKWGDIEDSMRNSCTDNEKGKVPGNGEIWTHKHRDGKQWQLAS